MQELGQHELKVISPMVKEFKQNVDKVKNIHQNAVELPIRMQRPYTYSKWDLVHEPENKVENILANDASAYKAVQPELDITLNNNQSAYVSSILFGPGEVGPQLIEVLESRNGAHWTL